jgi:hypothetical protein
MVCTESATKRVSRASSTNFVISFFTIDVLAASNPLAVSNDNNNLLVGPCFVRSKVRVRRLLL